MVFSSIGMPISTRIDPPGVSPHVQLPRSLHRSGRSRHAVHRRSIRHCPSTRHADNTGAIQVEIFNVSPEIDLVKQRDKISASVELGDRRDTVILIPQHRLWTVARGGDSRLFGKRSRAFAK
jgi:hypothetical protein